MMDLSNLAFEVADAIANRGGYADDANEADKRAAERDRLVPIIEAALREEVAEVVPEALREVAHKEVEIARLLGPSDEFEQAWLDYVETLVSITDGYLAKVAERPKNAPRRTDKQVVSRARDVAEALAGVLGNTGFNVGDVFESGNVEGGWIVEAEAADGFTANVEVVGGPWNDDGTFGAAS